jgi:hypothetical protein
MVTRAGEDGDRRSVAHEWPTAGVPSDFHPDPATALKLFEQHFLNRRDTLAFAPPWNSDVARAVTDGNPAALLLAHVNGEAVRVPWANQEGKSGTTQPIRVRGGTYSPATDGTTVYGCVDFDGGGRHARPLADPRGAALDFIGNCAGAGLTVYLEKSGGGQGWHVWVFLREPLSAHVVRTAIYALLPAAKLADGTPADARKNAGIEVFPKQDTLATGGFGNMVWLPWWHGAAAGGNLFYRYGDSGELVPYLPDAFDLNDVNAIRSALPTPRRTGASHSIFNGTATGNGDGRVSVEILVRRCFATGLKRNFGGFWFACQLRDNGYSEAEAKGALLDYQKAVEKGEHDYTVREALASLRSAYARPPREPWAPRSAGQAAGSVNGDGHGDAREGDGGEKEPSKPLFQFITSQEFFSRVYQREWLINNVITARQPFVLGGALKTLKTTLLVEMALSIGLGRPFLNQFAVPRRRRVAVMSGESGEETLQETGLRISKATGHDPREADVLWEFTLPQLANAVHIAELRATLKAGGVEVLLIDPLYLSLLAGVKGELSASNLYQIGPLLMGITQSCLDIGVTPGLVHHFKTTRPNVYEQPQLEDLAYSGIKEYARQ